jgi:hypothetical protein
LLITLILLFPQGSSPSKGKNGDESKGTPAKGSKFGGITPDDYKVTVIKTGEKVEVQDPILAELERLPVVRKFSRPQNRSKAAHTDLHGSSLEFPDIS